MIPRHIVMKLPKFIDNGKILKVSSEIRHMHGVTKVRMASHVQPPR
jgi:hypothetical protein